MNLARETEVLGGNLPGATLSTIKSHMTTRSRTPDRSSGKPATNRLNYGAATPFWVTQCFCAFLLQNIISVIATLSPFLLVLLKGRSNRNLKFILPEPFEFSCGFFHCLNADSDIVSCYQEATDKLVHFITIIVYFTHSLHMSWEKN
jgi:hypothetical protein